MGHVEHANMCLSLRIKTLFFFQIKDAILFTRTVFDLHIRRRRIYPPCIPLFFTKKKKVVEGFWRA
jgi:hypothetical protein